MKCTNDASYVHNCINKSHHINVTRLIVYMKIFRTVMHLLSLQNRSLWNSLLLHNHQYLAVSYFEMYNYLSNFILKRRLSLYLFFRIDLLRYQDLKYLYNDFPSKTFRISVEKFLLKHFTHILSGSQIPSLGNFGYDGHMIFADIIVNILS